MIFLFLRSGSTRICCRIPIQSANHSDEPLKANIMSAKASIMFWVSSPLPQMNWNPTAYPGGTSLKPLKIDLIWVLTEHTIKDLLASLTILYCVGRDLMAAPFSSANFGSGCLKIIFFYFPGLCCFCPRIWESGCLKMICFLLSGTTLFLPVNLGIRLFEDDVFSTFWGLHTST